MGAKRRGSGGGYGGSRALARLWLYGALALAGGLATILILSGSSQPGGIFRLFRSGSSRRNAPSSTFATIFHTELAEHFRFTQGRAAAKVDELVSKLKEMEVAGISTVVFSSPWEWFQPEEGAIHFDYLDWVAETACQNTNLKVAFIVDVVRAPAWVYGRWPDAKAMDSHGRPYQLLSWFHVEANELALGVLRDVTAHLTSTHRGCVTAVQPVYNNEYEAKFTQEHDCFQDYSPPALSAFRLWLRDKRPRLEELNGRWGTAFRTWDEAAPSILEAGAIMGVDVTPRYWDFLHFRELYGAAVLNRACAAVQLSGALCFHHVPEFFTVLDAVYGISMFKHIATSPHTDFLIIDSNFRTPYGTMMNPTKLRLVVSAAVTYGKPVFFEAAVDRYASLGILQAGFQNALLAGASGLGVTNWLTRLEMNASLTAAMHPAPPACRPGKPVGVFIHLDSCAVWHGLQWGWSRKDPLHDFVQDLADRLVGACEADVRVYLELPRLLQALPQLARVVFVEPLVLFGSHDLDAYALVKAALRSRPHEVLHLPANQTNGVQLTVLQDL